MSVARNDGTVTSPALNGNWRKVLMVAGGTLKACGTRYDNSGGLQIVRGGSSFFDQNSPDLHPNTDNSIRSKFGDCSLRLFSRVYI